MYLLLIPFWWVFTIPGRFRMWSNYMYPTDAAMAFSSERQRNNSILIFMYSFQFWLLWGCVTVFGSGLLLLYFRQANVTLMPAWQMDLYIDLNRAWFSNWGVDMINWGINFVRSLQEEYLPATIHN